MLKAKTEECENFSDTDTFYLGDEYGRHVASLWASNENSPVTTPPINYCAYEDLHTMAAAMELAASTAALTITADHATPASATTSSGSEPMPIKNASYKARVATATPTVSPDHSPAISPAGSHESLLFAYEAAQAKSGPMLIPPPLASRHVKRAAAFANSTTTLPLAASAPKKIVRSVSTKNLVGTVRKSVTFAPGS